MLLAADIGGAKNSLATYAAEHGLAAPLAKASFRSADDTSLERVAGTFLKQVGVTTGRLDTRAIDRAVFVGVPAQTQAQQSAGQRSGARDPRSAGRTFRRSALRPQPNGGIMNSVQTQPSIDPLCVNTVRTLSMDALSERKGRRRHSD